VSAQRAHGSAGERHVAPRQRRGDHQPQPVRHGQPAQPGALGEGQGHRDDRQERAGGQGERRADQGVRHVEQVGPGDGERDGDGEHAEVGPRASGRGEQCHRDADDRQVPTFT